MDKTKRRFKKYVKKELKNRYKLMLQIFNPHDKNDMHLLARGMSCSTCPLNDACSKSIDTIYETPFCRDVLLNYLYGNIQLDKRKMK